MSPSSTKSSTSVRVTVWAVFQLAAVTVRYALSLHDALPILEERPIVTFAVGCELRTTVKVAVPPASVVDRKSVGEGKSAAVCLSVLVTGTTAALSPVGVRAARGEGSGAGVVAMESTYQ